MSNGQLIKGSHSSGEASIKLQAKSNDQQTKMVDLLGGVIAAVNGLPAALALE